MNANVRPLRHFPPARLTFAALRLTAAADTSHRPRRPRPRFGHGAEMEGEPYSLLGCYHPSQQNTFTGRLTDEMIDAVLLRARQMAGSN